MNQEDAMLDNGIRCGCISDVCYICDDVRCEDESLSRRAHKAK